MKNKVIVGLLVVLALMAGYRIGSSRMLESVIASEENRVPNEGEEAVLSTPELIEKADYLKTFIQQNFLFDTTEQEMNDGMLKGMFDALEDPYSIYMNPDEFTAMQEDTAGAFGGIGVTVSPDAEDNLITVVAPIKNTPADRAGLRAGDKIIRIEGEDFTADRMDQAVKMMRGEPGTDVTITIRRLSSEKPPEEFDVTITREIINIISAEGQMLDEGVGYVNISSFDENTDRYFDEVMDRLEAEGAKGIVLDLRNNPGGLLDTVLNIADRLLPEGPVLITKSKDGKEIVESSDAKMDDIPMVVLVNEGSASASEILAGAIQDYERAPVIGVTSFGKGIVQRIIPLEDGSGFKLTVSEYFTPDERKIHEIGVIPDIEVVFEPEDPTFGPDVLEQDNQLQRAIEELEKQIEP